jgi:hypothetical protein
MYQTSLNSTHATGPFRILQKNSMHNPRAATLRNLLPDCKSATLTPLSLRHSALHHNRKCQN